MKTVSELPATSGTDRDLRFRSLFEGAAIGMGICDVSGQLVEANSKLCGLFGYSRRELVEDNAGALCLEEPLIKSLLQGERESFECDRQYRRKDGSELWGHLTLTVGRDATLCPTFLVAMVVDATEQKLIEDHLHDAERMEVIGRLAGGIAHDFNNLLTGILLYCDLLTAGLQIGVSGAPQKTASESAALRSHVDEVRVAGEQGAALTHQLLAVARKQAAEPRPVAINEIVTSTKNLLRRLIGEQIEMLVMLDPVLDSDAGMVMADPAQLRQIVLNLVLNARDALPQGGRITVRTSAGEASAHELHLPNRKASEPARVCSVSLTVTDTGCGMNPTTRARLFEPFFTTKNPGKGTGLGLGMVQRIVSEAGGRIEVESNVGEGTRIGVFFPGINHPAETGNCDFENPSEDSKARSCESSK